jgi:hypothetical protein
MMRATKPTADKSSSRRLPAAEKFLEPMPLAPKSLPPPEPHVKRCQRCHNFLTEWRYGAQHPIDCKKCEGFNACPTRYVTGMH